MIDVSSKDIIYNRHTFMVHSNKEALCAFSKYMETPSYKPVERTSLTQNNSYKKRWYGNYYKRWK